MKNIRIFLSENFHFLVVKCSIYFDRRVFVIFPKGNNFCVFLFAFFYTGPFRKVEFLRNEKKNLLQIFLFRVQPFSRNAIEQL